MRLIGSLVGLVSRLMSPLVTSDEKGALSIVRRRKR
jgi:hypothetical protein